MAPATWAHTNHACARRPAQEVGPAAEQEQEHFRLFRSLGFLQVVQSEEGAVVVLLGRRFQWSSTRHLLPSLQK